MEWLAKSKLSMKLGRTTVGCGIQGDDCLALALAGNEGTWRIGWSLYGRLDDRDFTRRLSRRVWRRPLWAPPFSSGPDDHLVICQIDLSFLARRKSDIGRMAAGEMMAALRTQVSGRFSQSPESSIIYGLDLRGPDGERHLVGSAVPRDVVQRTFEEWSGGVGIIHPHIASNAAAMANLYLALYPEQKRKQSCLRMLVLEGRETTLAVLMDDWRLLDAIQYRMMANQRLDEVLLGQWISFFRERNRLEDQPIPCVVDSLDGSDACLSCERWAPFADGSAIIADETTRTDMRTHPDLAALAFGMALQGA